MLVVVELGISKIFGATVVVHTFEEELGVSMYLADASSSTGLAEATQGPRGRLKQSTGEAGLSAGSRLHVA
uniref:Uncharacterized protein n=1 Tax=Triticum urartu TaxID=4572 RepID=A0A8R7P2I7_TRIUA